MKVSTLYGRKVVTKGGEGIIIALAHDGRRICGAVIADDNQREAYARTEDMTFGKNITCTKTTKKPAGLDGLKLGRAAFDEKGAFLGYLEEIETNGDRLARAKIGKKKYDCARLVFGDVVLVKGRTQAELAARDMFLGALCGAHEEG